MITATVLGIGLIFLIAGVVGIVDAATAPAWRRVAAERRERWEARTLPATGMPEPAMLLPNRA